MMLKCRSTLIITLALAVFASASYSARPDRERTTGQPCAQQNYTLSSQAGLNAFQSDCSRILGNLTIQSGSDITQLDGLSNIQSVGGSLLISGLPNLTSLQGLQSLATVEGSVSVLNNQSLSNTSGLSSLAEIDGDLSIQSNGSMSNLSGLSALVSVGGALTVSQNANLVNLDGFAGLKSVGGHLTIADNDRSGFNIEGLAAIESLGGDLVITDNEYLYDVGGLESITVVGGDLTILDNPRLGNVDGLASLDVIIGSLAVTSNQALSDCLALAPVLGFPNQADDSVGGTISVAANATGCSSVNDIFSSVASPGRPTITSIKAGDSAVTLSLSVLEAGSFPVTGYRAVCTDGVNDFTAVSGQLSPASECGISLISSDRFSVTQELGACTFSGQSTNQGLNNTSAQAVFSVTGILSGRGQISSEPNFDYGRFYINESSVWAISGLQVEYIFNSFSEQEIVRFEYDKDGSVHGYNDTFSFEITGGFVEQPYSPGSVTVGGLQNGTSYTCTASALSRGGESEVSPESIPVTPVERPQVDPAVLFLVLNNSGSRDSDDDGFLDVEDECPDTPGDAPSGCPTFQFREYQYIFPRDDADKVVQLAGGSCYSPGFYSFSRAFGASNQGLHNSTASAVIEVRNGGEFTMEVDSAYGDVAEAYINGARVYRAEGPFENGTFERFNVRDGDLIEVRYSKDGADSYRNDSIILAFYGGGTVCGGPAPNPPSGDSATSTNSDTNSSGTATSSGGRSKEETQDSTEEIRFGP